MPLSHHLFYGSRSSVAPGDGGRSKTQAGWRLNQVDAVFIGEVYQVISAFFKHKLAGTIFVRSAGVNLSAVFRIKINLFIGQWLVIKAHQADGKQQMRGCSLGLCDVCLNYRVAF